MTISEYLGKINRRYLSGISREHSYRADLESLIETIAPDVRITNEPANVTDCGNPDYVITRKKIPIGYIEAKDIGKDLASKTYKEQFDRYTKALDNLIITDYLWFRFYQHGDLVHEISIAEIKNGQVVPLPENFEHFANRIIDFCSFVGQTIKSAQKLAKMMAAKARLLQNTLENAVTSDEASQENTSLQGQLKAFKDILIHDIQPKEFADIYAQTLAYGLFAARLHDPSLDDFSRQEAAELIPKSNPFLRKLFQYIAGYDIDPRIKTTVDNLAEVFRATDVKALLNNFGQATQQNDPIIHFYETFLAEYDPKLRKSRGVWYTPEPVVNFIVRAVDDILKTEFGLPQGLADTSKTTIEVNTQAEDQRSKTGFKREKREVHKVQILDPATGTGTFLAEIIKHIYNSRFKNMQGVWSSYVENDLIPRLNGFEILMASYAMAHLKLDLLLTETGYRPKKDQRFRVYLTNSLEEYHPDTGTLFASWLSSEANEANHIKRDTPVMVVLGNPPYSVSSSNKSEWIENLMDDYKKDLNERNINPLSDDYLKFMRYGQYFIEKNGEGVLAYISNNSFIDGIIHRQVRKNLLETFDKIYILDLHGSAKKNEISPDGSKDENVFDIMQGVSINIFIKHSNKKNLAEIFHFDLFGIRALKYKTLFENSVNSISWSKIIPKEPNYFFCSKDFSGELKYNSWPSLIEIFEKNSSGIKTQKDSAVIYQEEIQVKDFITEIKECSIEELRIKYPAIKESTGWNFKNAQEDLLKNNFKIISILYRPFDNQFTAYSGYSNGFMGRPRAPFMLNFIGKENLGLICTRQLSMTTFQHLFISKNIIDGNTISMQTKEYNYIFPLYLYPEKDQQIALDGIKLRSPNLNPKIVTEIAKKLGLAFSPEKEGANVCLANSTDVRPEYRTSFTPVDLLDYIYAVLHSPAYREKYKEFLKIDFPRVPYPKDADSFWQLVALGGELREIHLLESPKVKQFITTYPHDGDNRITRQLNKNDWELYDPQKQLGRIWINDAQCFEGIPLVAWEFYIGGYQPAQKWLKDRRGRELSFDDILHYQKIIVALTETDRLMKEVDRIEFM